MTIDIKYENYSVKDFLEDDLFLQWQLAPTETLEEFWKQVLQQYPHQEANLSDAVRTLHSVTINHVSLSRREEDKCFKIYMPVIAGIESAALFIGAPVWRRA